MAFLSKYITTRPAVGPIYRFDVLRIESISFVINVAILESGANAEILTSLDLIPSFLQPAIWQNTVIYRCDFTSLKRETGLSYSIPIAHKYMRKWYTMYDFLFPISVLQDVK